jgi:AraC-like DNA-binding protein
LYIVLSFFLLYKVLKNKEEISLDITEKKWLIILTIGVSCLSILYFTNFILGITSYISAPISYSIVIYIISFFGFYYQQVFQKKIKEKKYKNLHISNEELQKYKQKLTNIITNQKPYLYEDFNLQKLSELTGIAPHLLSYLINEEYKQNFSEFINSYRIQEAKEKLLDKNLQYLSISGIGYECGFNSVSAFNTAFKKNTGKTPSVYKKENFI